LPTVANFSFSTKNQNNRVDVGNVTEKVLSAISSLTYLFFLCKRSSFLVNTHSAQLKECYKTVVAHYIIVVELKNALLFAPATVFKQRKVHTLLHVFDRIDNKDGGTGAPVFRDTDSWEMALRLFGKGELQTTNVWMICVLQCY
jgi:hypothetical protein